VIRSKSLMAALLAVSVLSTTAAVTWAASGQDAADVRQGRMKDNGKAMKAISAAVKAGAITPDLAAGAAKIEATGKDIAMLFPKGTAMGDAGMTDTDALPVIWEKNAEFLALGAEMEKAGAALAAAIKTGDVAATGKALGDAGKNCKACHDTFVKPKA